MGMFHVVFLVLVSLFPCILVLSIAYRLIKDKPMLRPEFTAVQFLETRRSGWSDRDALTRIGGGRISLWVAVDQQDLWISPHFPLNLLFIPEAFHLDFRIQGKQIMKVTEKTEGTDHVVRIQFHHATGDEDSVEFTIKDIVTFSNALTSIQNR